MSYLIRSEIHIINKSHRLFEYCDEICFKAKNLYNYSNYIVRQEFIKNGKIITGFDLNKMLKSEDVYKQLPAKTSQQVNIQLGNNWKSFFMSLKSYKTDSSKFSGKPKLPKYKKKNGRFVVCFDYNQGSFKEGMYLFPLKKGETKEREYIETKIPKEKFRLLQIIPEGDCYKISIIHRIPKPDVITNNNYLAIDLGLDNFATLTNNIGHQPIIINGRILKSINNYYNKKRAKLKSYVGNGTSKKLRRLDEKRKNIIETHTHKISKFIVDYCQSLDIKTIIIGYNQDWKRNSKMSKYSNQHFINIPHDNLICKIQYKAENVGVKVILIDEKYTSKSSFIDDDFIPEDFGEYIFSGKRVKRGLYKSQKGILLNADINGSFNILRKGNPEFKFNDRIKGVSLHPIRLNIA